MSKEQYYGNEREVEENYCVVTGETGERVQFRGEDISNRDLCKRLNIYESDLPAIVCAETDTGEYNVTVDGEPKAQGVPSVTINGHATVLLDANRVFVQMQRLEAAVNALNQANAGLTQERDALAAKLAEGSTSGKHGIPLNS